MAVGGAPDGVPTVETAGGQRRLGREVRVRAMIGADMPAVLSLLDGALGQGFTAGPDLARYTAAEGGRCACVVVVGGVVAGAVTGQVLAAGELAGVFPEDAWVRLTAAVGGLEHLRVGIVKSVAVSPAVRGYGLATLLFTGVISRLRWGGADRVVTIGWTDLDGCHIEGLVTRLGFTERARLPNFWLLDSRFKGYLCPSCGSPCRCEGAVFALG